jgi:pyruvate/oxaloacetate carboxyltransferase
LLEANIQMVRFVFHPNWADRLRDEHAAAKTSGLATAINVALASKYSLQQIADLAEEIASLEPDVIYIADTCGALTPSQVTSIINAVGTTTEIGFHGHDYLTLAIANSLAAVQAGARWIDTSLLGLGRGAGNARSEIWGAIRARAAGHKLNLHGQLQAVLQLHRRIGSVEQADWISVVCGAINLSPPEEDTIRRAAEPHFEALKLYERFLNANAVHSR